MCMDIKLLIKEFIEKNLVDTQEHSNLTETDPLLTSGIIDSVRIVKLLTFLNDQFAVNIEDDEIIPDNFETIASISNLVETKIKR